MVFCLYVAFSLTLLFASSVSAVNADARETSAIAYPSLLEVEQRLRTLSHDFPDLVEMYSAQDQYGVPSPGNTCVDDKSAKVPCKHWFVSITNRTLGAHKWASASPALRDRPQVFLSGNLHGDEWVGPVTLITLAELLVGGATGTGGYPFNPWLARMVNTRTVVILVVSNPFGYDSRVREDFNGEDPNRDFAYDREDDNCMSTTIGRALNEDFLAHAYQVAVTFHGGMQEISWEWGSMSAESAKISRCPDAVSSEYLGDTMRDMAGKFGKIDYYPAGIINVDVYPVSGGMEDWAYAGLCRACRIKWPAPRIHGNPSHPNPFRNNKRLVGQWW